MSTIKVNTVTKRTGSTLTLGESGTTVTLACGATQTGFGRTGTVNWVTTKKTTGFTAVSGEGYFCDTAASGAFTLTLPSSPSAGDIVGFKDYNGNFATANLTIGRGGSPINGSNSADVTISTAGASIFLVYVDASQGWVATQDDESTFAGEAFLTATGGTITTSGDCKIHTFTSSGNFVVSQLSSTPAQNEVSYMVVGGGGGAGTGANADGHEGGAGGGAGGFRELKSPTTPYTASPLDGYPSAPNRITVTAATFPIVVGAGGAGGCQPGTPPFTTGYPGTVGSNSSFSTITGAGGGKGGSGGPSSPGNGGNGGSGGGSGAANCNAGTGNTPPVSPAQGTNGTVGSSSAGGAGGGATAAAGASTNNNGADGGAGATTSINATPTAFAGGGGGAGETTKGCGGAGGGGAGYTNGSNGAGSGVAGTTNTGGGGGGAFSNSGCTATAGGAGGSGVVIIRYKFQ